MPPSAVAIRSKAFATSPGSVRFGDDGQRHRAERLGGGAQCRLAARNHCDAGAIGNQRLGQPQAEVRATHPVTTATRSASRITPPLSKNRYSVSY